MQDNKVLDITVRGLCLLFNEGKVKVGDRFGVYGIYNLSKGLLGESIGKRSTQKSNTTEIVYNIAGNDWFDTVIYDIGGFNVTDRVIPRNRYFSEGFRSQLEPIDIPDIYKIYYANLFDFLIKSKLLRGIQNA